MQPATQAPPAADCRPPGTGGQPGGRNMNLADDAASIRETLAEMRESAAKRGTSAGAGHDVFVPAPGRDLRLRIYRPGLANPPGRGLIFVHGGGWVAGTLDGYDRLCLRLARDSQATVISVDYRLAPEHPFPAALEDCCAAAHWVQGNRDELGIGAGQLTIAGSSAGGNLALATSLKL